MSEPNNIIPVGKFPAKAIRVADEHGVLRLVQWQKSQKGNVTMLIHMDLQEPEYLRGRVLPWFATWTENTQDRLIESLTYLGMKGDDLSKLDEEKLEELVQIVVEHEERDRKDPKPGEPKTFTQARIAWVNRLNSGTVTFQTPMPESDVKVFAASMRSVLQGKRAAGGQRQQQIRQPAAGAARPGGAQHPNAPGSGYGPGSGKNDDLPF